MSKSKRRKSSALRGLGSRHRKQREYLMDKHHDGDPCWWCGEPMYRDKNLNYDGMPLAADHIQSRNHGGKLAGRLLHFKCNSARGNGDRDYMRPVVIKEKQDSQGIEVEPLFYFDLDGVVTD